MPPWDRAAAEEHLEELAKAHDICIIWSDLPEVAYTRHRTVRIRRPFTADNYFGALHEMGHVMSPRARFHEKRWNQAGTSAVTEYDDQVLMEIAAWAWACWNLDPDLRDVIPHRTWQMVGGCLVGYLAQVPGQRIG